MTSLKPFFESGVISSAALHFARRVVPNADHAVALAAALAVEAVLNSNTCLDIATAHDTYAPDTGARDGGALDAGARDGGALEAPLDWPSVDTWVDKLRTSEYVAIGGDDSALSAAFDNLEAPLVLDGNLLFLRRFQIAEDLVARDLLGRAALARPTDMASVDISDLFPASERDPENRPLQAARLALSSHLTILTGGPGTGKTHTLSRIIAALWRTDPTLDIALAAPTGKAATRMRDAVAGAASELDTRTAERLRSIEPNTLHRLIGLRPGEPPRHNRDNQLPHDVVVIDEASMISLPLMADLLNATRGGTRLILVGDPYQLASVEAGSVLGDLVDSKAPHSDNVVELTVNYRSIAELDELFQAVNHGNADRVIDLLSNDPSSGAIRWVKVPEGPGSDVRAATAALLNEPICSHAAQLIEAAVANDIDGAHRLLTDTKLLCATRRGPLGLYEWTERIEAQVITKAARHTNWYVGRPVMVTRNDYITGLLNGDTGVTMNGGDVSFPESEPGVFGIEQLSDIETWWAMTIHKSQGSEFRHAIVSIDGESRISSRELLYTALTRAKEQVTVVGSESSIRSTVARRAQRTSGLLRKLSSAD